MSTELKAKTKKSVLERVALDVEISAKVNAWKSQLEKDRQGIKVSTKDLVNWVLLEAPELLSRAQLNDLHGRFYDELRFLSEALKEMREAKKSGKEISLDELFDRAKIKPKKKSKKTKKRDVFIGENGVSTKKKDEITLELKE